MNYIENIQPVNIEKEIKDSFLDYAMSVIITRALPDVRDGLKPVHRRILYAMQELRNYFNRPYLKSARIVGDTVGKFHPHGDSAVYETLVRMAQDFSLRYPLIDKQGNFGSIDGDPPAAMRYTEARMARVSHELLQDIDKDTVNFGDNYDGSLQEPLVLPARIPNLLINGSSGIAVGMATNIPPHNLGEVADGLIALIHNPDITIGELTGIIPGPDFPTAGFIYGQQGLRDAYRTGRGIIKVRGRIVIETRARDKKKSIIISELPYQVNKSRLMESIAELYRNKKIEGISEIRDESDREGMRIVIEVKRDYPPEVISNTLYKHTQLETSFGINMMAIVNQAPVILTLKEILSHFLDHRREIIIRRTKFDLAKAEARAHILEGLRAALDKLDLVIDLIRNSDTPAIARTRLQEELGISEIQAQAILDLRLHRLTGLEREAVENEYQELVAKIADFKDILESEQRVFNIIEEELIELKETFGDERRTEIIDHVQGELNAEDFIVEEDMVVTISHTGYIKRSPISLYRAQRRGGKGVTGSRPKEEDFVERLYIASTHSYLLFLTSAGHLHWKKVHEVPQGGRLARGKAMVNLLDLAPGETVATVLPVKDLNEDDHFVVMATKKGLVKRTELTAFSHPSRRGIICLTIKEGDELVSAALSNGQNKIFLATSSGKAITFAENDVRSMGRNAAGVRGIRLAEEDLVVGMEILSEASEVSILTVTANGFGKRSSVSDYRKQGRGGLGLITIKTSERNGPVIGVFQVVDEDELMLITDTGRIIRTRVKEIRVISRNTQGVKLIDINPDEKVSDVARLDEKDDD
ncbi:MAG: DNA gyrase subunit A [Deltaproteobacteria bacterium]|nr:DNA gyrase subunit A [Deltaproteobacteria bacterium]